MMKRICLFILVALLAFSVPAFATSARYGMQTSQPVESTAIMTDAAGNAMDYEVWLYGVSIYADAASSYIGLYDCDTLTELASTTEYPKYEIGEPTQYETTTFMFDTPMYFADGVGAIISVGVGFVHYGPEPTS